MGWKVFALVSVVNVMVTTLDATGTCENTHICEIHGPVTNSFCSLEFEGIPMGVRACCLSEIICTEKLCPDFNDIYLIEENYDIYEIAMDVEQYCECEVVTCVLSLGVFCDPCSPGLFMQQNNGQQNNGLQANALQANALQTNEQQYVQLNTNGQITGLSGNVNNAEE